MALLPPVPTIRFRSEPRFPTNKSLAEFGHHIIAGLHDYSDKEEDKDISTAFTTEPLARFNQHAIDRAIQDLAKESALELARSLVPRLKARFEDRVQTNKLDESSQKTTLEKSSPVEQFRNSNNPVKPFESGSPVEKLDSNSPADRTGIEKSTIRRDKSAEQTFSVAASDDFLSDDLLVKDVPDQANEKEREVATELQIGPVLAKRVSQLALHDFIILAGKTPPLWTFGLDSMTYLCA